MKIHGLTFRQLASIKDEVRLIRNGQVSVISMLDSMSFKIEQLNLRLEKLIEEESGRNAVPTKEAS